jgi:hypothetical protein
MTQLSTNWGRGTVYKTEKGTLRCEWSSGEFRQSGRIKYHVITLRGSYEAARTLMDLIVLEPYRSKEDALNVIAPYIKTIGVHGPNPMREIIEFDIGPLPSTYQVAMRARIQLDYWRVRLLDTIEAYRRFDDA